MVLGCVFNFCDWNTVVGFSFARTAISYSKGKSMENKCSSLGCLLGLVGAFCETLFVAVRQNLYKKKGRRSEMSLSLANLFENCYLVISQRACPRPMSHVCESCTYILILSSIKSVGCQDLMCMLSFYMPWFAVPTTIFNGKGHFHFGWGRTFQNSSRTMYTRITLEPVRSLPHSLPTMWFMTPRYNYFGRHQRVCFSVSFKDD